MAARGDGADYPCRHHHKNATHQDGRKVRRYRHRWIVERTFARLLMCRRLSKDVEELPATREALICLAMSRLMVIRLAPA
jgi:transposase